VTRPASRLPGFAAEDLGACADVAVVVDEAERNVVTVVPFVVVDAGPVEHSAHVDAAGDGVVGDLQASGDVVGADLVVTGANSELSNQDRGVR
jgi:hypothetical protein